jgi:citrate lyase beta subunit
MKLHEELSTWAPMLYVPGDRADLLGIVSGGRNLGVCSLAICLEDAVLASNRPAAAAAVSFALRDAPQLPRPVFVRPATFEALDWLLEQPGIERVSGFILPKATVESIHKWIEISRGLFQLLPIMESREALDPMGRRDLALACAAHRSQVPAARIGANDFFSLLGGLRRPPGKTVYETPVGYVINGLIEAFGAQGVRLCGPVFDRMNCTDVLTREIDEDVSRGLFAKTALNPGQARQIWDHYRPQNQDIEAAESILDLHAPAVFNLNECMLEPACHSGWARRLLQRARAYERLNAESFETSPN